MITKILPIVLLVSIFYIGSIYSSRNLSKKLEKKSQVFHDPIIDNYLKSFQSILELHNLKVFVLNEKQIKTLDKTKSKINPCITNPDFCKAINSRIEKTRKQLLGLNLQARIEKNHQKIFANQKKD